MADKNTADSIPAGVPEPTPAQVTRAKIVAMAVRNAMEALHGGGITDSLTDDQMRKLNPIIRDAVLSTLHAIDHAEQHPAAQEWLAFQSSLVPDYWEEPRLSDDYLVVNQHHPTPEILCTNCCRPVFVDAVGLWTHGHPDGGRNRGCRAASYRNSGTYPDGSAWDESLPRYLTAKGPR